MRTLLIIAVVVVAAMFFFARKEPKGELVQMTSATPPEHPPKVDEGEGNGVEHADDDSIPFPQPQRPDFSNPEYIRGQVQNVSAIDKRDIVYVEQVTL